MESTQSDKEWHSPSPLSKTQKSNLRRKIRKSLHSPSASNSSPQRYYANLNISQLANRNLNFNKVLRDQEVQTEEECLYIPMDEQTDFNNYGSL